MEEFFSISEAARLAHTTSETLRHYDRIGLVKPSRKDPDSGYRYYTRRDIVRLNTVHALAQMDLSLREIKEVLGYDDLGKIIVFLEQAEHRADEKIRELQSGKEKIRLARADYERKLHGRRSAQSVYISQLPQRVILLSEDMEEPTLDNLWNYHRHFYAQVSSKEDYVFEDLAGIYTSGGRSRMFAQCQRHGDDPNLLVLPQGTYLCADCSDKDRAATLDKLLKLADEQYGVRPDFAVQIIVISGILTWNYRIQVLLD